MTDVNFLGIVVGVVFGSAAIVPFFFSAIRTSLRNRRSTGRG